MKVISVFTYSLCMGICFLFSCVNKSVTAGFRMTKFNIK